MDTIKYKNNKYLKVRGLYWVIIGENQPTPVTIGHFSKVKEPEIIVKLEQIYKDKKKDKKC